MVDCLLKFVADQSILLSLFLLPDDLLAREVARSGVHWLGNGSHCLFMVVFTIFDVSQVEVLHG